jgi:hypothetical protein
MGKVPTVHPMVQTSRWTAAARARESERPYRLFDDPLASALAGPEGFAWLNRMEPVPGFGGPALYVVIHMRFFDDFLLYACRGAGVRQVVLLAAGMDARAFRPNWPPRHPTLRAGPARGPRTRRCPAGLRAANDRGRPGTLFLIRGTLERRLRSPGAVSLADGRPPLLHERGHRTEASRDYGAHWRRPVAFWA